MKYQYATDNEGFSAIVRKLKDDKSFYEQCAKDSDYIAEYYSKEHVGEMWREYYPRILKKFKDKHHKK